MIWFYIVPAILQRKGSARDREGGQLSLCKLRWRGVGGKVGPKKDDSKIRVGLLQHYISSIGYRLWRKGGG